MIEEVVKNDGSIEPFIARKINGWGKWSARGFADYIEWPDIVTKTVAQMPRRVSSKQLNHGLIKNCIETDTWAGQLMAGRIYATQIHKEVFGGKVHKPIKQIHEVMQAAGIMVELNYSQEEYEQINLMIDHERDFNCAWYQLKQGRDKYALRNRITGRVYETRQLALMRVAMVIAEWHDPITRLAQVQSLYDDLSLERLSAPTPNHNNMGTGHNGFFSCCLYTCDDTKESIAANTHIAEVMTYMSAGLGNNMQVRSLHDPIRNGSIAHQGKAPYYNGQTGIVKSNKQGARGGSLNQFFSAYDPEHHDIMRMKNPRTPLNKRNRSIDYTMMLNQWLLEKSAKLEDVFVFNCFTAPDLYKALYGKDINEFIRLYEQYEQDEEFHKKYYSAREIVVSAREQGFETGRFYMAMIDEINYHTPHRDTIYSSNLCVAPETTILTDKGNLEIRTLVGQKVNVWNGFEWSEVEVVKTGVDQVLITVELDTGEALDCTRYHKFYVKTYGETGTIETPAGCLDIGDRLIDWIDPYSGEKIVGGTVVAVKDSGRVDDTYCFTEYKRHMGVFNGILTGQCVEITQPTYWYDHVLELYSEKFLSYVEFTSSDRRTRFMDGNRPVYIDRVQGKVAAIELKVGDVYWTDEDPVQRSVIHIHGSRREPEVSLCALAAIIVTNIDSDEQYFRTAYNALYMIDFCIDHNEYALPHMALTAKARRNAGVGMMDLAHYMARKGLKYNTTEGYQELHRVAERHAYWLIKASIQLGRERGNAEWMHKTDWPRGWTPYKTYNRNVDTIAPFVNQYDWDALSQELIDNGGQRNSSLIAYMPGESSSKYSAATNSIMGLRYLSITKTDADNAMEWVAPEADTLKDAYTFMWDLNRFEQANFYCIFQKWTDQAASADYYAVIKGEDKINASEVVNETNYWAAMGGKTWYYTNCETSDKEALASVLVRKDPVLIEDDGLEISGAACTGGGCSV